MTSQRGEHDASSIIRAAIDVLVYAPLGLGAMLIEDGPRAVAEARQELRNARFIGRFTVDQGVAQLRNRLETATREMSSESTVAAVTPEPARATGDDTVSSMPPASSGGQGTTTPEVGPPPEVTDLALPDYDTLPAIDIVAKLDTLSDDERDAIERYESAHRQRRTVLGKIAQLGEQ